MHASSQQILPILIAGLEGIQERKRKRTESRRQRVGNNWYISEVTNQNSCEGIAAGAGSECLDSERDFFPTLVPGKVAELRGVDYMHMQVGMLLLRSG